MRAAVRTAIVVVVAAGVAACSIGETNYETITLPVRVQKETRTCESPFVKVDLSKLKACGSGKSHCYPAAKTSFAKEEFEPCEGSDAEVCLPDPLLEAGGAKAKSCTFLTGAPGACVSMGVKQIEQNKNALQPDVCDKDTERCAPCTDPRDGSSTHMCEEQGVHEKDCVGGPGEGGPIQTCCYGLGVCLNEDGVPPDNREHMSREVCSEGKLCAPAALADGNPTKCEVLGFDGVCMAICFAPMLKGVVPVMRSNCGPTEACMPCMVGKDQGLPGCD